MDKFSEWGRYKAIDGVVEALITPVHPLVGDYIEEEWVKCMKVGTNLNGRIMIIGASTISQAEDGLTGHKYPLQHKKWLLPLFI